MVSGVAGRRTPGTDRGVVAGNSSYKIAQPGFSAIHGCIVRRAALTPLITVSDIHRRKSVSRRLAGSDVTAAGDLLRNIVRPFDCWIEDDDRVGEGARLPADHHIAHRDLIGFIRSRFGPVLTVGVRRWNPYQRIFPVAGDVRLFRNADWATVQTHGYGRAGEIGPGVSQRPAWIDGLIRRIAWRRPSDEVVAHYRPGALHVVIKHPERVGAGRTTGGNDITRTHRLRLGIKNPAAVADNIVARSRVLDIAVDGVKAGAAKGQVGIASRLRTVGGVAGPGCRRGVTQAFIGGHHQRCLLSLGAESTVEDDVGRDAGHGAKPVNAASDGGLIVVGGAAGIAGGDIAVPAGSQAGGGHIHGVVEQAGGFPNRRINGKATLNSGRAFIAGFQAFERGRKPRRGHLSNRRSGRSTKNK